MSWRPFTEIFYKKSQIRKILLDEQKILYKDRNIIKRGLCPANLPIPARWPNDEAYWQRKGIIMYLDPNLNHTVEAKQYSISDRFYIEKFQDSTQTTLYVVYQKTIQQHKPRLLGYIQRYKAYGGYRYHATRNDDGHVFASKLKFALEFIKDTSV